VHIVYRLHFLRRGCPSTAQPQALALVSALADRAPPALVVEVPSHGLFQRLLERLLRPPAEFGLCLRAVDGVAAVMARPVGHEAD